MSTIPTEITAATESSLNVESIKGLMDAFDPAALLPDLSKVFGSLVTVCRIAVLLGPVILLILGLAYLFLSPKEANYYFGYRCYFGMGSVRAWRFTQRMAGLCLGGLGLVLTVIMAVITGGYGSMDVMDMVWNAVNCLIWEAVLALVATLTINLTAMALFDAKGEKRRRWTKGQS
ncbi:MAG: SdpI family protein [Firmicutes bacterium]|nr:SdpI family protein [Bacillota bacterium]